MFYKKILVFSCFVILFCACTNATLYARVKTGNKPQMDQSNTEEDSSKQK